MVKVTLVLLRSEWRVRVVVKVTLVLLRSEGRVLW